MLKVSLIKFFWKCRRIILKHFLPEFVWPKEVLLDSTPIKLRNAPYSFGVKYSILKGTYEKDERTLIQNKIQSGDIIFEFGCSHGILTKILLSRIGVTGIIIAIEASHKLSSQTELFFKSFNNVRVINGYGFPVGKLCFKISINTFDESGGSLGGKLSYSLNQGKSETDETIYDIKRIIEYFSIMPNVLVIDVEGTEKILCEQQPCFPDSIRIILIELHPHFYGNTVMQTIIDSIISEGFSLTNASGSVYLFERYLN